MNKETMVLIARAKSKPRKRKDVISSEMLESLLMSNKNIRKAFIIHTAKGVFRNHKKAMELLADK